MRRVSIPSRSRSASMGPHRRNSRRSWNLFRERRGISGFASGAYSWVGAAGPCTLAWDAGRASPHLRAKRKGAGQKLSTAKRAVFHSWYPPLGSWPSFHTTRIPCFPSPVIGGAWADCCHFVGIWIVEALLFSIVPCFEKENYFDSTAAFSRRKLSSLITCSIRQASRSAISGSTPAAIRRSVKKRCFS